AAPEAAGPDVHPAGRIGPRAPEDVVRPAAPAAGSAEYAGRRPGHVVHGHERRPGGGGAGRLDLRACGDRPVRASSLRMATALRAGAPLAVAVASKSIFSSPTAAGSAGAIGTIGANEQHAPRNSRRRQHGQGADRRPAAPGYSAGADL